MIEWVLIYLKAKLGKAIIGVVVVLGLLFLIGLYILVSELLKKIKKFFRKGD